MRNILIALLFLFVEVSTAFVVPSKVQEHNNTKNAILKEINIQELIKNEEMQNNIGLNEKSQSLQASDDKNMISNKKQNAVNDKEIYDQENLKQSNVNERSFIYLKQKYRTPYMNQFQSTDFMDVQYPMNYKKGFFDNGFEKRMAGDKSSYFTLENTFNYESKDIDQKKETNVNVISAILNSDCKSAYLELLKTPQVRPKSSTKTEKNRRVLPEQVTLKYCPSNNIPMPLPHMKPKAEDNVFLDRLIDRKNNRVNNPVIKQIDRQKTVIANSRDYSNEKSRTNVANGFIKDTVERKRLIGDKINSTRTNCVSGFKHNVLYRKENLRNCAYQTYSEKQKEQRKKMKRIQMYVSQKKGEYKTASETTTKLDASDYGDLFNDAMDLLKPFDR